jgi:predicted TIM-barrel fold metal-dependent hydrolase
MVQEYREQKRALRFLDSNLWVGRQAQPGFCQKWDVESLLEYMDRYAIEGGIATHSAAPMEDPYETNEELLDWIEDQDRLWGGLVVTTELPRGYSDWGDYLDHGLSRGARLVRLFPKSHRFSLARWCSGELLDAIHERRIPLALWHIETGWDAVKMLCDTYPSLPLLIEGRPQKIVYHNRFFYPLLERYANLHLELHNLNVYLGIEDMVERFGPEQLVFGSCMPLNDPNTSQMMVTAARIAHEAKHKIARGNLQRLLDGVVLP